VGGPKGPPILRRRIAILGKWTGDPSRDTCYVVPGDLMSPMATFTIPEHPVRRRIHGIQTFNVLRGGEYFFMPSLSALRWIGSLRPPSGPR